MPDNQTTSPFDRMHDAFGRPIIKPTAEAALERLRALAADKEVDEVGVPVRLGDIRVLIAKLDQLTSR